MGKSGAICQIVVGWVVITGEFTHSLDEKGRLMIPARMRAGITGNVMILTRGVDACLWLFPTEEWRAISAHLMDSISPFQEKARLIQRWIIAPAQEAEVDRTGRLVVPQTLREYAGLKKECRILGMLKYIEIWEDETYLTYLADNKDRFKEATEELASRLTF